jgi:Ca-activated chloride channel family protein
LIDNKGQNSNRPPAAIAGLQLESRWLKPVVPRGGGEAVLLVRLSAANCAPDDRQAPLDVAFVLDRSGSMANGKLDLAKSGVDLAVAGLRGEDRVALVVYDDDVDTVHPLQAATPRSKTSLRLTLHGVDPGGSTNLSAGWLAGCGELANAAAADEDGKATRIRRVILLTDGLANVGITAPHDLAGHASELRRRGIATTTIGVGQDFDEGLLSAMAEAGGGNFQYAANAHALRDFFNQELQALLSVTATGLTVTLQTPPGVTTDLIAAFPVESRDGRTEVAVGDVVAGDEIDLVFSLRIGAGSGDAALPIDVTATWTDPRADLRRELAASPAQLRFADQATFEGTPPDPMAEERAALQRAAAERRAGLELDRLGRYEESRARMFLSQQHLQAAPMTMAVRAELQESESLAAAPASMPYPSHARKLAQYQADLRRRGRYRPETGD